MAFDRVPDDIQPTPPGMRRDGRTYLALVVRDGGKYKRWELMKWGRTAMSNYKRGWVAPNGLALKFARVLKFYALSRVLRATKEIHNDLGRLPG